MAWALHGKGTIRAGQVWVLLLTQSHDTPIASSIYLTWLYSLYSSLQIVRSKVIMGASPVIGEINEGFFPDIMSSK
jgi:hypothetical protein